VCKAAGQRSVQGRRAANLARLQGSDVCKAAGRRVCEAAGQRYLWNKAGLLVNGLAPPDPGKC
jgi:hypothetical protein